MPPQNPYSQPAGLIAGPQALAFEGRTRIRSGDGCSALGLQLDASQAIHHGILEVSQSRLLVRLELA